MSLYEDLKTQYGLDQDGCIALIQKTRNLFFQIFGEEHAFCKSVLTYYDDELFKIKLLRETEIANLDKLWEQRGDKIIIVNE